MSGLVAILVSGIEAFGLVADKAGLHARFWNVISTLGASAGNLVYVIGGVLVASWIIAPVVYMLKRFHSLDLKEKV